MAKVIGKVMFPNGKYIKDGEEKTSWLKCGVLLESEKGMRLKMECMPIGVEVGGGWFSIFSPDDEYQSKGSPEKPAPAATQSVDPDDSIPF
jgi:hypothetical protein